MSKTNISVTSNVDAIIILSPNPTGNIFTNGVRMNNVGPDKNNNKNRYGFFCLMMKNKLNKPNRNNFV